MLGRLALCIFCSCIVPSHAYNLLPGVRPSIDNVQPSSRAVAARMGLIDWLGNLIYESDLKPATGPTAGSSAVSRLKVVLAHDRTGLDEVTMAKIRGEIQDVIAKYVKLDLDNVQFDMQNDNEITLVTASFPLAAPRRTSDRPGAISAASSDPSIF